jgi:hypothetical protein
MCKRACTPIQDKDQYLTNVKVSSHYFIKTLLQSLSWPEHLWPVAIPAPVTTRKMSFSSTALFSFVSYYHFTSANEAAQVYSKLRDLFNSDRITSITRHDDFMLNNSQLINNYTVTWRCITKTADKEPKEISRNTLFHRGRNKKNLWNALLSIPQRQTPCLQQLNHTAWSTEYLRSENRLRISNDFSHRVGLIFKTQRSFDK